MEIIKKFFNNLKKIKIEKLERQYSFDTIIHYNNYKNKNKNKNNIFYEFNNDDYDKETIKNKTSENFYDTYNDKNFSFISECKKNYIYNRKKRINNQNFQEKKLLKLMSTINVESNNKMITYENKKNCFDNENNNDNNDNNDNDIMASPFFNRIVSQKKDTQTQSTYD